METLEDKITLPEKNFPVVYVGQEFHNASFSKENTKFEYKAEGSLSHALIDNILDPNRYVNPYIKF